MLPYGMVIGTYGVRVDCTACMDMRMVIGSNQPCPSCMVPPERRKRSKGRRETVEQAN